jgi:Zn-dependent metalloprotease
MTLVLALALGLMAVPAEAAKDAAGDAPLKQRSVERVEPSYLANNMRISSDTGVPLALYRVNYRTEGATLEAMASDYLTAHRSLLQLNDAELKDLLHHATRTTPAGATVRYRQQYEGVPVYGADLAVTLNRDNLVTFVMNGYKPGVHLDSVQPTVSARQALRSALAELGVGADELRYQNVRLVVFHQEGVSRLAWEVKALPVAEPVGDWELLIDARTGEIFQLLDRAFYAPTNGTGNVFDPDPLSSSGASYGDPGYTDGSDADTTQMTGQLVNVTLQDIDLTSGTYSLTGPWAEIVDSENPRKGLFSQSSSAFNFTRQQDGFEAVNCYYHIDKCMRYINNDLGVSVTPYQYNGGVRCDPHGLNGSDNSRYSSSAGDVAFGEGGVDDAEDADVVIHELGHGLHDWLTNGGLSQVNGLSEGFGDYIAQSYSRSLGQWTTSDPEYHWVFHWDGHNPFWNGRITNDTRIYPDDLVGQVHTDGQIWSSCNMRIWDAIGRQQSDRAHLVGLSMTNSGTNQQDAAQAVLQAAIDLGYPASEIATMDSIYTSCGYQVSSAVCGNGVKEGSEECDGADLGGALCSDVGCSLGAPSCTAQCVLDFSGCSDCAQCNFDGVCDSGEDCNGCPQDCISGSSGAACGNGICEAGDGEDCLSCPQDCNGQQSGNPNNRYCCGDGDGQNPVSCSDSRCGSCTDIPTTPVNYCCGDFVCEGAETGSNCAVDCGGGGCSLGQPGDACVNDSDCCSNNCKGKQGAKTCK